MSRRVPIPKQEKGPNGEKLCRWCKTPVPKGRRTFCGPECVHEAMLRSDPGYLRRQVKKRDKGVCSICGTDTEAIKLEYRRVAAFASGGFIAYERSERRIEKRYGFTRDRWHQVRYATRLEDVEAQVATMYANAVRYHERSVQAIANGSPYARSVPHPDQDPSYQERVQELRDKAIILTPEESRVLRIEKRFKRLCEARRARMQAELLKRGFHDCGKSQISNLWQADHIHPVAEGGGGCGLENMQTACTPCHKAKTKAQAARAALIRRGIDPDNPPQLELTL